MEKSLIILKPDAVQRGLIGQIITRLEQRGLKFMGMKLMQVSPELAQSHYGEHEGKPFFGALVSYITSSPVVVIAIQGKNVVQTIRNTVGATNPMNAAPGTIRGDFGLEIGRNLIHASDSPESGEAEVSRFFDASDLITWERNTDAWIHE
ncbi:MAG: nucleoside-diphosphate kinase [Chloroflexaceae bacterium]|jgi:nucleoside-diphosphate kinase|nr:nucleoside-diphosphate kinase [Chloroflexaceae bacterium]